MRSEIRFIGRVQGVGFRATAKHLATDLGVNGWVRNEADGSVHLVVEGDESTVKKFLDEMHRRLQDHISDEQQTTGPATGRYSGFEIR